MAKYKVQRHREAKGGELIIPGDEDGGRRGRRESGKPRTEKEVTTRERVEEISG